MSLLSELKVDFVITKGTVSESLLADSLSNPALPQFVTGSITGPIGVAASQDFKDSEGNQLKVPDNALPILAKISGTTTFVGSSLMLRLVDGDHTGFYNAFGTLSAAEINTGALLNLNNSPIVQKVNVGYNILEARMLVNAMPAGDVVHVTLGYLIQ